MTRDNSKKGQRFKEDSNLSKKNSNPQKEQMEHDSMVTTLSAQTQAIWPQESTILFKHLDSRPKKILDLGSGTGLIAKSLSEHFSDAHTTGVDILEKMTALAASKFAGETQEGGMLDFIQSDARDIPFDNDTFDLVVNRHVLQIIPNYEEVLVEIARVTKPGGHIHILAEDYGMIHFDLGDLNSDSFWQNGPLMLGKNMGTEMQVGRKLFRQLRAIGFRDIKVDYVIVDTLRVAREIFVAIWRSWKDGYTEVLSQNSDLSIEEVAEWWNLMIDSLQDENTYAVWHVPIYSAKSPR